MARLIRIRDRVFDLDAIVFANYIANTSDTQCGMQIIMSNGIDFKLYDVEADKLWEILKSSAMNIPIN